MNPHVRLRRFGARLLLRTRARPLTALTAGGVAALFGVLAALPPPRVTWAVPSRAVSSQARPPAWNVDWGRRLDGRVTDQDGAPVAGARVALLDLGRGIEAVERTADAWRGDWAGLLQPAAPPEAVATLDDEGYFRFAPPVPGLKMLVAEADGWVATTAGPLSVPDGMPQGYMPLVLHREIPVEAELESPGAAFRFAVLPDTPISRPLPERTLAEGRVRIPGLGPSSGALLILERDGRRELARLRAVRGGGGAVSAGGLRFRTLCGPGHACPPAAGCREWGLACLSELLAEKLPDPSSGTARNQLRCRAEEGRDPARAWLNEGPAWDPLFMARSPSELAEAMLRLRPLPVRRESGDWIWDLPPDGRAGARVFLSSAFRARWSPPSGGRLERSGGFLTARSIRPCEALEVSAHGGNAVFAAVSGGGGEAEFPDLPEGRWVLRLRKGVFAAKPKGVLLRAGSRRLVEFQGGDLTGFEPAPVIYGFVSDPEGRPLPKAEILCQAARGPRYFMARATSDEDGFFRIDGPPPSESLAVLVQALNERPVDVRASRVVMLNPGDLETVADLAVWRSARVLRLLNPAGRASSTRGSVLSAEELPHILPLPILSDARGEVRLENLPPGRYRFEGEGSTARFEVAPGQADVEIRLSERAPK